MSKTKLYVIVGFLGCGKTTFLKNISSQLSNYKVAVVINDFGDMNTDVNVLENEYDNLLDVTGGSIFCSCKTDKFIDVVAELSKHNFDYILIEGSGLANPSNIYKIIDIIDDKTNETVDFSGVIGIVDSTSIHKTITTLNAVKNQIVYSDIIILNKIDISSIEEIENAKSIIKEYNKTSLILESEFSKIPFQEITDLKITRENKTGFKNVDLNIQKATRFVEDISVKDLELLCEQLFSIMDRIKGVININGSSNYFEYINQELLLTKINSKLKNYIVFLSTIKKNIDTLIDRQLKNMNKQ